MQMNLKFKYIIHYFLWVNSDSLVQYTNLVFTKKISSSTPRAQEPEFIVICFAKNMLRDMAD